MKISLNAIRNLGYPELVKLPLDELVRKIGAQLGEIETIEQTGPKYDGILVARVVSCVKHPNADKLSLCKIDDGGVAKSVERDQHGYVQVVCGAPNVKNDMTVAWIPPGAIVPSTWDKEKFKLEARQLRGQISNGMLASAAELAIGDGHDGILEIRADKVGLQLTKPGTPFKQLFGLDDVIIDVENKMFTHRPDCFGILGVARELAGIQGKQFDSPDWYIKPLAIKPKDDPLVKGISVENRIPSLVPRYQAVVISDVQVMPSPLWLQSFLSRMGAKPINNIVDMTNFLMLVTGQPLHAFDFDKVAINGQANIVLRTPAGKEELELLDGKTITPRDQAILIATPKQAVALGGVMGGSNSAVDSNTKRIIIESANFNMYNIRRTAMEHGLFTDAVTRFNKGQSVWQTAAVLAKAVQMTAELSPGAFASSKVIDQKATMPKNPTVQVGAQFINERLGLKLTATQIDKLLETVEFYATHRGNMLSVTAPFWRTDIAIAEDIVEEVGRLTGYDKLPVELPKRSLAPVAADTNVEFKKRLRNILSQAGANELLTYSFVHSDLLAKAGQDSKLAFELSNALSPSLQYYRMSIMPSLLDKVHANVKAGYDQFAIYELGKVHNKLHANDDVKDGRKGKGLPTEMPMLALLFTANAKAAQNYSGAAFYQARHYLDYLANQLGVSLTYTPIVKPFDFPVMQPYDQKRTAIVSITGSDIVLGCVGEFRAELLQSLKLPAFTAGFEIGPAALQEALKQGKRSYQPLAKFPRTSQDISLKLPQKTLYSAVLAVAEGCLSASAKQNGYKWAIEPLDIYQPKPNEPKNIALHITLWHPDRTLTTEEANKVLDNLAAEAKSKLQAERL